MAISKIKTNSIADNAITSTKIGVDVIVAEDIAANAITVAEISNGAVTTAKLDSAGIAPTITGGTITGATFAAGAVGTPSITTTGDTNTGIFFPAADTIAFAEGGAEIARFDSSANLLLGTITTPSGISNSLTFSDNTFQKSANITVGSISEYNANTSLPTTVFGRLITSNTGNATTLTLPSLSGQSGKVISISNINIGPITVVTGSSNGVIFGMGLNGGDTIYVPAYSSIQLSTDGGNWKALTSNTVSATTGAAPYYGARAWVNFNGTGTVAIRGSGNVSSITDNGTGSYTMNFTTAMPDINYSVTGISSILIGTSETIVVPNFTPPGTETASLVSSFKFAVLRPSVTVAADVPFVYLSVFR